MTRRWFLAAGEGRASLFGDEGRRRLLGRERELFPRLVRPWLFRLLWAVLLILAAALLATAYLVEGRL